MGVDLREGKTIAPSTWSLLGVRLVQVGNEIWAACGPCGIALGWTWDSELTAGRGKWSCLDGCGKVYDNKLGPSTSSVIELDPETGRARGATRNLNNWVIGWLDRADIEVTSTGSLS